jgi:hypothetical protein
MALNYFQRKRDPTEYASPDVDVDTLTTPDPHVRLEVREALKQALYPLSKREPSPMHTGRMLRGERLTALQTAAAQCTRRNTVGASDKHVEDLLLTLATEKEKVDATISARRDQSKRRDEFERKVEEIREYVKSAVEPYEKRIKKAGYESVVDDVRSRMPIGSNRYDHIITWRIGVRMDVVGPTATIQFVADPNSDATGGQLVIFFQKNPWYKPANVGLLTDPRFVEMTDDFISILTTPLAQPERLVSIVESKIGPLDKRTRDVAMAIASEAARLIALYAKIALDAESEWDRCDIMLYDHAAAERDIKNLVGLFSHREP